MLDLVVGEWVPAGLRNPIRCWFRACGTQVCEFSFIPAVGSREFNDSRDGGHTGAPHVIGRDMRPNTTPLAFDGTKTCW